MKIRDFLCSEAVTAEIVATEKKELLAELLDLLIQAKAVEKKDKSKIVELLLAREALGSTAIGQGIAIPHCKFDHVNKLVAALGVSKKGVRFDALDGEPVFIFFLLIAPIDSAGPHLKALARISRILKDKYFREHLKSAKDDKTILKLISQENDIV